MSAIIEVRAERSYTVQVDCTWQEELATLLSSRSRVAIVVPSALESKIDALATGGAHSCVIVIPDGEVSKSSACLTTIWEELGKEGFTRSDVVVAIGGGTTTDIAGFAAATWLRGIDWIAIPTSMAGMVDAAIGGKTGMNSSVGKNLIGAFHSPSQVLIDLSWLGSLSDRDFAAGLAEVIKTGFISDPEILKLINGSNLTSIRKDRSLTVELIARSIRVKAAVVSADFKESFAREILNYGHTVGHAIELHSGYSLRHGEAVSIGMVYAAELANIKGILDAQVVQVHREILANMGLPIAYDAKAWPQILQTIAMDKKARGREVRFVGISAIGTTVRMEKLSESDLTLAYERITS